MGAPQWVDKIIKTDEEWAKQLTRSQYEITRAKGTERPFCGTLLDNKKEGVYYCVCCDLPLFSSSAKFNSGTGWPSFFQPFAEENIGEFDTRFKMQPPLRTRVDIDRYCLNSESLTFREAKSEKK
ncbi:MAG: peptide-methionine (R)-S-oxide reductase [Verrucomicrobia bacterium]|nr:peptide-methionine (R)-S-oxide reductase [Verrucomicrobiota bacterium]